LIEDQFLNRKLAPVTAT